MSKTKIISLIIICIIIFVFIVLRFNGSTAIKAIDHEDVFYSVTLFRQNDERWKSDTLGESSFIMEKSGCLTTCIAAALSYNMDEITPGELNKLFTDNDVYDANGNILWSQLENVSHSADVLSSVSEDAIFNYLKAGRFPIVRVRVNGYGNFHYVLIIGIENGEYICMDPLEDNLTKLSDYFNQVYAIRVVY